MDDSVQSRVWEFSRLIQPYAEPTKFHVLRFFAQTIS